MRISSKSLTSKLEIGLNHSIEFLRNSDKLKKGEEEINKSSSTFDASSEGKKSNKTLSKFKL